MSKLSGTHIALFTIALGSNACSGASPDESSFGDESSAGGREVVGQTTEALISGEYFWSQSQGSTPTTMLNDQQYYCFLTGVTGHFVGDGEDVRVIDVNGTWQISGKSGQQGVGAWARCMAWTTITGGGPASWTGAVAVQTPNGQSQGSNSTSFGWNGFCALAGIGGAFSNANTYAFMDGEVSFWGGYGPVLCTLYAVHADSGNTNLTRARGVGITIGNSAPTADYQWRQGQAPVRMGSLNNTICLFERIQGNFQGSGESVRITLDGSNNWILSGTSQQTGVAATARCRTIPSPAVCNQDWGCAYP